MIKQENKIVKQIVMYLKRWSLVPFSHKYLLLCSLKYISFLIPHFFVHKL